MKRLSFFNSPAAVLILCATLGLAPFVPEPHIWGKIKWVAGGAFGRKPMDWGDLAFHGFPWMLAFRLGIIEIKSRLKTQKSKGLK